MSELKPNKKIIKEHVYANLFLWGWVALITGVSCYFKDDLQNERHKFEQRQKRFLQIQKEKRKVSSHKKMLNDVSNKVEYTRN